MLKRLFDLGFATAALVALAPLLLVIAAAIKLTSPGPVFYRGERAGRGGRPFRIFKFRTMVVGADKGPSSTPDDDPRITRVGGFLRQFKLDELPQFLNVLAGQMSVVGPRPQVLWVVQGYTPEARRLLEVRPGITDFASIRFRDEGAILRGAADPDKAYAELIEPEKIRLGLEYVAHHNLAMDCQIIAQTVLAIFQKPEPEPAPASLAG